MNDQSHPSSKDPKTLLSQALLAHRECRDAAAEDGYQQALALDPQLLSGLVWYALLLMEHGRVDEATAKLDQAIAMDAATTATRLETALKLEPDHDAIQKLWKLYENRRKEKESVRQTVEPAPKSVESPQGAQPSPTTPSTLSAPSPLPPSLSIEAHPAPVGHKCPHCGTDVRAEVKICPSCSKPVRVCPSCGNAVTFQAHFCTKCSNQLTS